MSVRKSLPLLFLVILIQTIFAFYYSSKIIDYNQSFYQHQLQLKKLQTLHQNIENQLGSAQSIPNVKKQLPPNLIPIYHQINLQFND